MTKWNSPMQQFKRAQRRQWWDNPPELPKDHDAIPDSLGIGIREYRNPGGELVIILANYPGYIALGKYAQPKANGALYYVGRRIAALSKPETHYFEHLLPAVAYIMELKERFDAGNS